MQTLLLLFSALLAPQPAAAQPSPAVVFCYDPLRDIVQERMADACEGRIIDAAEAARIRARLAREKARKIHTPTTPASEGTPRRRVREFGTAFAVDGVGHYLTAAHVVDVCPVLSLRTPDGVGGEGTVIARDAARDIALILGDLMRPPLPLRAGAVDLGAAVRTIGYPFEGLPRLKPRITEGTVAAIATLPRRGPYLALRLFVRAGTSGGPVLDESDSVVGMLVAKINTPAIFAVSGESVRDLSYAVAPGSLRAFLIANGISPTEAAAPADPARSVLRVECSTGKRP